jgi:hypothetical protein
VLLLAMLPRMAWADPPAAPAPLTPVPPGPDVILTMPKGTPAPVDGHLFDQPTALRWANYLQQCNSRLKLDVVYQYKVDQADVTMLQTQLKLERDQYSTVTADLQKRLTQAQMEAASPPFYKTVTFGLVVGVVLTAVIAGGAAILVKK